MPRTQNMTSGRMNELTASIHPTSEEIAARAFDLYQRRGAIHGADLDDWLEAERQLLQEHRDRLATV